MKAIFCVIFVFCCSVAYAWEGDSALFHLTDDSLCLRAPQAAGNAYLSCPIQFHRETQWSGCLYLAFTPSSSNYARLYLFANQANLCEELQGYYLRFGHTDKNISLYRQNGSSGKKLAEGAEGRLSGKTNRMHFRVHRSAAGRWTVWSKTDDETEWFQELDVQDESYTEAWHWGIVCTYTSTRSQGFIWTKLQTSYEDDPEPVPEPDHPGGKEGFYLTQKSFAPQGDERLLIPYQLTETCWVNLWICHANGYPVRQLCLRQELPLQGKCVWDGLDNDGRHCEIGLYIVCYEAWNENGKRIFGKIPFALTAK